MSKARRPAALMAAAACAAFALAAPSAGAAETDYLFSDSHVHLTNYVQEGVDIRTYLKDVMGDTVGRSVLFGIPLQQMWSYGNSGEYAPSYYLNSDAPLYYYSFTDAFIAQAFLSLPPNAQARLDPMITGFNPSDMYAADHIRRVLKTFPGVFSGIGEFSIHKEFVSSKIPGEVASLTNPALDRILDFAGEAGLVVVLHNDIDVPFAKTNAPPMYLDQMKALLRRHPKTTIIWAHTGLGRVVHPTVVDAGATGERPPNHLEILEGMLADPGLSHVYFDISWDEVAKYVTASPEVEARTAALLNRYPDRFLFGTDNVAPSTTQTQLRVFHMWDSVFAKLTPEASRAIRKGNYERLFDAARVKVRAWETANARR
ncbi:MAG: amidohydrolase family protein [Pseudomonadota bacterium]